MKETVGHTYGTCTKIFEKHWAEFRNFFFKRWKEGNRFTPPSLELTYASWFGLRCSPFGHSQSPFWVSTQTDQTGQTLEEKKSGRFRKVPAERRCEMGQRMAVKQKSAYCVLIVTAWITASQTSCWDVGGLCPENWTSAREGRTCWLQLWVLFKPHKSDRH